MFLNYNIQQKKNLTFHCTVNARQRKTLENRNKCHHYSVLDFTVTQASVTHSHILTSSGKSWKYCDFKWSTEDFLDKQQSCLISPTFPHVPNCLGSKPVSCGVRKIHLSLFIFLLMVSPSVLIFSHHPMINKSEFLIRLGKHKTPGWLHLRKRTLCLIKYPPAEAQDRRQTTCFRNLYAGVGFQIFCDAYLITFEV